MKVHFSSEAGVRNTNEPPEQSNVICLKDLFSVAGKSHSGHADRPRDGGVE